MEMSGDGNQRQRPNVRQWFLAIGSFLLGLIILVAARAEFISVDDLAFLEGTISIVEQRQYWEDTVLYVKVSGEVGRFKIEDDWPGYAAFLSAAEVGAPVRLGFDAAARSVDQPAVIFHADVAGVPLVVFRETASVHNREACYVMLLGPAFCFLGYWIWYAATRPIPSAEQLHPDREELTKMQRENPRLFSVVRIVDSIRRWGEEIPKFGDLFTVFLFFWILPLYVVFLFVTARTWKKTVRTFCCSYWILLLGLCVAACVLPEFPGAEVYPALGPAFSRLFNVYLLTNIGYGAVIWIVGTFLAESDSHNTTAGMPVGQKG